MPGGGTTFQFDFIQLEPHAIQLTTCRVPHLVNIYIYIYGEVQVKTILYENCENHKKVLLLNKKVLLSLYIYFFVYV